MIISLKNEKVKYWVSLKDKKNRDVYKEYIIEGEHLVQEAYKNGYLKTIIYVDKLNNNYEGVEKIEVNESIINKITTTQTPQKIAGVARYFDDDKAIDVDKIVVLDGVQDPGNAGTIVRNSLAFGYNLVFFSSNSVDIYNSKFIRSTQGYFYSLKLLRGNVTSFISTLKNNNYDIIATCLMNESIDLEDLTIEKKHCLVFGNEGQGVSNEVINLSNKKTIIKMNDNVDSLNVAVASGIIMYKLNNK